MNKMIVTSLTLINYIRMSVGNITKFVYTPDDSYQLQLILGSNGSGKSSLMGELWPLPGEQSDFGVGGRKELIIQYKSAEYILVSDFSGPKPQHQFIVDGFDMNDGGKIEMFRSLCEEHFGVTNEIRALAMEKDSLTNMSPGRRRYWLIKLADTDFTFAIRAYNMLKDAHRDASGSIRRLQKRVFDEVSKVVDKTVVEEMTAEIKEIRALIDHIYSLRNSQARKLNEVLADVEELAGVINRGCDDIERLNLSQLETSGYKNRDEMQTTRENVKLEIHSTQQLTQHLFTDHSRIKKKYDVMIKAGTESIAELEEKKSKAEEEIAYKQSFLAMPNVVFDAEPTSLQSALDSVYTELFEKISNLPANDGYFSSTKAQTLTDENQELNQQLQRLSNRITRMKEDIEHKRSHVHSDSITCPSCKHSWTTKASEDDLVKAEALVLELQSTHAEMLATYDSNGKYLKEMSEYSQNYRAATMTIRSVPILAPYLNEITQNSRLVMYPNSVAIELYTVRSDLEHHIEIARNKKIIAVVSEQIELKKNMDADTIESIEKELNQIEETMSIQTQKLNMLQEKSNVVERLIQQYDQVAKLNTELLNNHHMQNDYVKEWVHSRYQELLWHLIMNLQTNLARKEDALNAANAQQAIVDQVSEQLEEATMNERVAKAAHIALSPTNGAIAEGLHRFMNGFVISMNKIINAVWTYPLEIQPFVMEDGIADMDYKFPFRENRTGKPKKDVDEGSESMLSMFNFTFKVCALRQLGLDHLALFLDEFEAKFDDSHRERAIYLIKKLIDEKAYGQIFMVSHYESNHGALSSLAQTCVLSRDNLMLPTNLDYNGHVTIS